jgi:hypothetical protein
MASINIAVIIIILIVLFSSMLLRRWLTRLRGDLIASGLSQLIKGERLQLNYEPTSASGPGGGNHDRQVTVMVQSDTHIVEVSNRLAKAAEDAGRIQRTQAARNRAALRAAGDVRMPPDVEAALRSSRLVLSSARYARIRSLYLDYLVWAVWEADDELIDLFWQRSAKPIFASILVFSLAESMAAAESTGNPREMAHNIGTVYTGKRVRDLRRIAQVYHLRARTMIAMSKSLPHARWLGRCWGGLRPQVLQIAFAEEMTQNEVRSSTSVISIENDSAFMYCMCLNAK